MARAAFLASRTGPPDGTVGRAGWAAFAGLAYLLALLASHHFGGGPAEEAHVWIASGVAIGVLTLAEPARWPFHASALALAAIAGNLMTGAPLLASMLYALTEIAAAAGTAWLLRRLLGAPPRLDEVNRLLLFVAVGAFGGALLVLLTAAVAYGLLGMPSPLPAWRSWLVSTGVGTLVVTPLIFAWARFRPKRSGGATMTDFAAGTALFVLLVAATVFVFAGDTAQRFPGNLGHALTWLPLPFLVLGGVVWGARGATLATFVMAAIAVSYTARDQGPFAGVEAFVGENVLEVQGYVAAAALLTLMLTALQSSRQRALAAAADWKLRYEAVIAASDRLLYELDPVSGRIRWAGDTERLLGLAPGRIDTLAAYLDRVHPGDRETLRGALSALGHGRARRSDIGHRFVCATGDERLIESEASAIVDFDDSVHRVVGFLHARRVLS